MTDLILRGPMIRFDGDPFQIGDEALIHDSDAAVVIQDGLIADVGDAGSVIARWPDVAVQSTPHLMAPGFVDAHMHYPQIGVVASWGADLIEWLSTYTFPEEGRFQDPGYAAEVAKIYFDTQLAHGITCAASFCTTHPASVDAYFAEAARRGVAAVGGKVMMDRNAPDALRDTANSGYEDSKALINRWHRKGRARYAVTPRFAPTSSPEQLEAAGTLWAEHPDCLMQTHLSEQHREIAWVAELFPDCADYLGVYEKYGLIGPKAVFGHAIHLTDREHALLSETEAAVAHCPTSNAFLGSGACDVQGLAQRGVRIGLATDTGGGTSYSIFDTMKAAYELAQTRRINLTPVQLWWLATQGSARALHMEAEIGNIKQGLAADLILIDLGSTALINHRMARASTISEALFVQIILADDRAINQVWASGSRAV
ncbi:MAG: guanine deaminase [Pseudomonadota bacterium]